MSKELNDIKLPNSFTPKRTLNHYAFCGVDNDSSITIPLCGVVDPTSSMVTRLNRVTCLDCLESLLSMINVDYYEEAVNIISNKLPIIELPDPSKINKRFNGAPTLEAEEHMRRKQIMDLKQLNTKEDAVRRCIGNKETFYLNLLENRFIHPKGHEKEGQPMQETINLINQKITELGG